MSKLVRRMLAALALIGVLAVLLVWMGPRLLGGNVAARLSTRVSEAVGMQVSVEGPVSLQLFPRLHLILADVHIRNGGTEVAAVAEVQLTVALRALLHRNFEIEGIRFQGARIHIERDRGGRFNVEHSATEPRTMDLAAAIGRVAFSDSSLTYKDAELANDFSADHCDVGLQDLQLSTGASPDLFAALSFSGALACAQLQTNNFLAEKASSRVTATHGVLAFDPAALQIFGGRGSGRLIADFTGTTPVYHLRATIEKLQLAAVSKTVRVASIAKGELDFSTDLTLRGTPKVPVMRTASGQASLRGTDLELEIGDLDKELSRYESTQSFNLLDLGAFFLAGPLGVAVTKGYDYARILKRAPGETNIRTLISRWQVEDGVARAEDVALATSANRIAMHGGLDFVAQTYEDVTVALLSPQGCARVEQKIRGSFDNPVIYRPSVVSTLTGPVRHLIDKGKSLVGAKCPVFYSGSVPAPH